jgi:hypothetical protein
VTVEIPRRNPGAPSRIITGSVIWVQRPSQAKDLLHIGLEFDVPGNVWDYSTAPDDWFPLPGEQPFVEEVSEQIAIPMATPVAPVTLTASWDASEILAMAGRAEGHEAEIATAMKQAQSEAQEARAAAAEAAVETLSLIRPKHDTTLQETIDHAVRASIERLSASIVEEVRRANQASAVQVDEKIRSAVAEALALKGGAASKRPNRGKNK